jgi:hypothetical protein
MTTSKRWKRIAMAGLAAAVAAGVFWPGGPEGYGEQFTVNPGSLWFPVITELTLLESRVISGGNPGPPYVRVAAPFPGVAAGWKALRNMVTIKRRAFYEDEPVISGWRTLSDPSQPGVSGLEVKRSDQAGGWLPIVAPERGGEIPVRLRIEIWGRYRIPGHPKLQPGDPEYQQILKQKIRVTDFALAVYKIEGELSALNIKNKPQPEPYLVVGSARGGLDDSLAAYEARTYKFPAVSDYIGELRLEMKLRFPEAEIGMADAYEGPLEGAIRFICGSNISIRKISDAIRQIK